MTSLFWAIFALMLTYVAQYVFCFGLIVIGYYSDYIQFFGGFLIWIFVYSSIYFSIFKIIDSKKTKVSINENNDRDTAFRLMAVVVLVASYWQNNTISKFYHEYEYMHYGKIIKVVVSDKYTSKTNKGGKIYEITFTKHENNDSIVRYYSTGKEEFDKLNIGDSILIAYSTRKRFFTKILNK